MPLLLKFGLYMSNYLDRLKSCYVANDLFKEFRKEFSVMEKEFWNTIYFRNGEIAYVLKNIPKSTGGERILHIPSKQLKHIQKRFSIILYNCLLDIRQLNPNYLICNHSFERKRTIITNAKLHRNKKYVLNIDLSDFFSSIHYGRIYGFFQKDRYFKLSEEVAKTIAQISCYRDGNKAFLPQGSPLSPIIASLIGNLLDVQLIKIAKAYKLTYSRYADDLTFSSNNEIPESLIYWDDKDKEDSKWVVGRLLREKIEQNKFSINDKKTRLFIHRKRQTVTGIVVNKQLNVTSSYRKKNRAMLHHLLTRGDFFIGEKKGNVNQLIGRLNHVVSVKYLQQDIRMLDSEWIKERDNLKLLCAKYFDCNSESDQSIKLLRQAIFYKYFIGNNMPIVIPEGKTDSRYFRLAYKKLNGIRNKYMFQNINSELIKIGLSGGAVKVKIFLEHIYKNYKNTIINLEKSKLNSNYPVIFILDYDKGLKIGKSDKNIPSYFGIENGKKWTRIRKNIYLLLLKPLDGNSFTNEDEMICVEDLLKHHKKVIKIDKNNHEQIEIGNFSLSKMSFLRYVEKNHQEFDFSNFKEIFSAIEEINQDYQYKKESSNL